MDSFLALDENAISVEGDDAVLSAFEAGRISSGTRPSAVAG